MGRKKVVKRKQKPKGMTSEEVQEKIDGLSLGSHPPKVHMECLGCGREFTKKEADEKRGDQWWKYAYCSMKCFAGMLEEVREKLNIRYGECKPEDPSKYYRGKSKRKIIKRGRK